MQPVTIGLSIADAQHSLFSYVLDEGKFSKDLILQAKEIAIMASGLIFRKHQTEKTLEPTEVNLVKFVDLLLHHAPDRRAFHSVYQAIVESFKKSKPGYCLITHDFGDEGYTVEYEQRKELLRYKSVVVRRRDLLLV